jgi:hypothetical protein
MSQSEAVIVLGGGLTSSGEPTPWVVPRLDRALEFPGSPTIVVLGAGTPHKPPPNDAAGFPVHECAAMAQYLIEKGCPAERIVMEACSADTIGNAYFSRVIHVDPRGWKRLAVVTSDFHMPRTVAIFERVFALPGIGGISSGFSLEFSSVPDIGLDQESLDSRRERERKSLTSWLWKAPTFASMQELSQWLFTQHECYAPNKIPKRVIGAVAQSY